MLTKRKLGQVYYLDINIGGERVRRSLKTTKRLEALSLFSELRDKLLAEHKKNEIKFEDFCVKYMDWAWIDKKPSAPREESPPLKADAPAGT